MHSPSLTAFTQWNWRRSHRARNWNLLARCVQCALIAACSALIVPAASADEIDDYIAAQMARQHIPGLSLLVVKDGKTIKAKGYGLADLELRTPATPETVYQIGSVSKQFIAAGIVLLVQDGKVGFDDSIRKYLEDAPDAWQAITLRHLLSHTSGLVKETPDLQLKAQSDIDALRSAYPTPLSFAPGEKWQYSNLGYFALVEVISRAGGMPWTEYLHERIFARLGMNATRPTNSDALISQRASGYHWMDTAEYRKAPIIPGVRPSGAFLSTVLDLAKWDAALNSDELFTPQQRELMWTPVKLKGGTERPYGFGWELGKTGQHRQVKHGGTMFGFRSQILRFPDDRLTIVVLTNATQAIPEKITLGVAALHIPDLKPALPKRAATKLSADALDGYTGNYLVSAGRVLTVARREDQLTVAMPLQGLGKEVDQLLEGVRMDIALLTPESTTRFFDADDSRSTYVFSTGSDGRPQFVIEDQNGKVNQTARKQDERK